MESGTPAALLCRLPGIQTVPADVAVVPPTMSDFSHRTVLRPSSAPTRAAVIPAAPAPITSRSASKSHRRLSDSNDIKVSLRGRMSSTRGKPVQRTGRSQEPDRYPGYECHQQQPDNERDHIAGDRLQPLVRMHPADGASSIVPDAEGRRE